MNHVERVFSEPIKFLMPPSWLGATQQEVNQMLSTFSTDFYRDPATGRVYDAYANPLSPAPSPTVIASIQSAIQTDWTPEQIQLYIKEELALRAKHFAENSLLV